MPDQLPCDRCGTPSSFLTVESALVVVRNGRASPQRINNGSFSHFCDRCFLGLHPEVHLKDVEGQYAVWWNDHVGIGRGTRLRCSSFAAYTPVHVGSIPAGEPYREAPEGVRTPNMVDIAGTPAQGAPPPTPNAANPTGRSLTAAADALSDYLKAADVGAGVVEFRVASKTDETFRQQDGSSQIKDVLWGELVGKPGHEKGLVLNASAIKKLLALHLGDFPELFGHRLVLGTVSTNMGPSIVIVEVRA